MAGSPGKVIVEEIGQPAAKFVVQTDAVHRLNVGGFATSEPKI